MGKISPVSIKYIIHADLQLTGVADKPDIIGAVFGQTEGLLGSDLELRELQKSGRIGRIDVKLETKSGKTFGEILLPSSMGKSETAIIAAALETIERVGPCDAKIKVNSIEDVRISKRNFILDRAKDLLQNLVGTLPDSQAFTNKVTQTVRTLEITEYGIDRLPAGPMIDDADEIIVVEGRADVLNMLRYGIRNVIGLKGAKATDTIVDLARKKVAILFIDGDRGGELTIRKLAEITDIDYVARAPDGKEVEELTLKEIHKALRLKVAWEQVKAELKDKNGNNNKQKYTKRVEEPRPRTRPVISAELPKKNIKLMKNYAEDLIGTRGAFVLDESLNILGRVPVKELQDTLENISEGVFAVVMDGAVDQKLASLADNKGIRYLVSQNINAQSRRTRLLTPGNL